VPLWRRRRRRRRHRRRRAPNPTRVMAAARAGSAVAPTPAHGRLASIIVHPARLPAEPVADGFRLVEDRRRRRRAALPRRSRPVPPNLVGLCFNCLRSDHVNANCMFPARCLACKQEGHRARDCVLPTLRFDAVPVPSPSPMQPVGQTMVLSIVPPVAPAACAVDGADGALRVRSAGSGGCPFSIASGAHWCHKGRCHGRWRTPVAAADDAVRWGRRRRFWWAVLWAPQVCSRRAGVLSG
jgi:hypothetical protein